MSYAMPQAPAEPEGRLAYKWKVLISILFGIFMIILDTTVVNVAFQTLRREYDATLNQAQWIISVYVLALGITTPMSGYLADRFGIKRIYIIGLAVFVTGSVLVWPRSNACSMLIVARTLQAYRWRHGAAAWSGDAVSYISARRAGNRAGILWYRAGRRARAWSDPGWTCWSTPTSGAGFSSSTSPSACWVSSWRRASCARNNQPRNPASIRWA